MELPHRFVPTASKFVSPVRIVAQTGHRGVIVALAFSPCHRYLAASDSDTTVKVWCIENLDVVGSYRIGFVADQLKWLGDSVLECSAGDLRYQVSFEIEKVDESVERGIASRSGYIPLLGAPEYTYDDEKVTVLRGDSVYEHPFDALVQIGMESCERYVVALSQKLVEIYGTSSDETLCSLPCAESDAWRHFFLDEYGSYVMLISERSVWMFDPIREQPRRIVELPVNVTAQDFSKKGLLALGDVHGNITIVSSAEQAVILRTPRYARSFSAFFPSPDKAGLIAIRDESVSAFMGVSQEILSSAPLPASLCASCAGSSYTECVVACDDDNVYRLKLDTNDITRIAHVPEHLVHIHCVADAFVAASADNVYFYDGARFKKLDAAADGIRALSLNEKNKFAAMLYDSKIELWSVNNNKLLKSYNIDGVELVAFGKDKTADTLFAFNNKLEILTAASSDDALSKLNVIEDENLKNARLISVASAAKSFLFVLCEINHGQLAIVRVGLNSGKSSIVLRVFVAGKQIWGAAVNNDYVQLRDDASCLRIVQGLTTYSVEDWSRSEPLALY